ncbi:RNA polymerase II transcription factor SIII subunit A-domain-containing protein [Durotheca rogersii]|uniref:RNA polymerase II transcription factor SIII subunit A-domain-containing protein n=1 Tax=Durotheca rogersii TaxID=419775 RepID=UPI00221F44F9|nr:RNA polymerase II transcription factor SIII subunit A-domain-containing protein [Durotheca rogersii]KAI5867064.1 RNA polymerase II transcription factor SIII subunit A-domain-containing protein [Durotheca rogersii]
MVKTLVDLCTAVCVRNVRDINDIGGAPYSLLRPILLKIDNAAQLRELEERSPHLREDDAECWHRLIKRDFPIESERRKFQAPDPASWHEVYDRYEKLVADSRREAAEKLQNSFKNIEKEKAQNVSSVVNFNPRQLRAPKDGRGFGRGGPARDAPSGVLRFTGGSRTKTNTAQNILKKARREAMEISRRNHLSTPTGKLPVRPGQITHAPLGMVEEYRIKALPAVKKIHAPQPRRGGQSDYTQKEQEAKLLRIKNGTAPQGPSLDFTPAQTTTSPPAPAQNQSLSRPSASATSPKSSIAIMKRARSYKTADIQVVPVEKAAQNTSLKPTASSPSKHATSPGPWNRPKESSSPGFPTRTLAPSTSAEFEPGSNAGPGAPSESSPEPKQTTGRKRREPVNIFVKPKQKVRRLS